MRGFFPHRVYPAVVFSSISRSKYPLKQSRKPLFLIELGILSIIGAMAFSSSTYAQNVPAGESIGGQATRQQQEVEKIRKRVESKKPSANAVETTAPESTPLEKSKISFVLKAIDIQGMTIFSHEQMASLYASFLNTTITYVEINTIIDRIKTKYKQSGYFTTTAYLPQQEIKNGFLAIVVIEGRIGKVRVEGNKYFSSQWISSYIHASRGGVLNINELNRDVLRLNQNSDLQVKAVLSPGQEPGTVDVTLKVHDQLPWHAGVTMDNQGTRLLGYVRGGTYLRSTNVTGRGDSLFISSNMNSRSAGESITYRTPIDTQGTTLGISYSHFWMRLGQEYKSFDIKGISDQGSVDLNKELYLTENIQVNGITGLYVKSILRTQLDQETSDDQLRIPYLGIDLSENDNMGTTSFSPRLEFGTSGFMGASSMDHPSGSRADTGGFYALYTQTASRTENLFWESYLRLSSQFQATSHTLPYSEQIQIGGEGSVRGYPEGDYLADLGGYGTVEWNFPMYLIPKDWKLHNSQTPLRHQIEPYIFVDMGGGMLKEVLPGERATESLWSAGGGFRVHLYNSVYFNIDLAQHLGDKPTSGSGPSTVSFSLQVEA